MTNPLITRFYVDSDSNYLGGWSDGNPTTPDEPGTQEVPTAPDHAMQKYDFQNQTWLPLEQME